MEINIMHLIEGAKKAEGLTVIIDVFRAFSVDCYLFNNGARKVIPVGEIERAYELKEKNPQYILMGERDGRKQPGFDYGNSPTFIEKVDFSGKTIVHTTSAGTQGLVNVRNAREIITGSFVNARAVANYIKKKSPGLISLVCMGNAGKTPNDEDTLCARYIKSLLEGKEFNLRETTRVLKNGSGKRFFDPANQEWSPARDFELCLQYNKFNFVLKAKKLGDELVLEKEEIGYKY